MNKHNICVFEHQTLKLNQKIDDFTFDTNLLIALQKFYGEKGVPYYTLIHNGVKFCEYVGVIQIGNITIEILPKADKNSSEENKTLWRDILIKMIKYSGLLKIHSTNDSNLTIKPNHILDLYFEIFLNEVEFLLHKGLNKTYKKIENNSNSLKGKLNFSKNISKNLIHKEHFYVEYNTYNVNHKINEILYKTILLLKKINTNTSLQSRIDSLILNFPEQKEIKVLEMTFQSIVYNRKNQDYQKALEISKLLLLNYHPDISHGKNNVLALMFDMNLLWEKFVYKVLKKELSKDKYEITEQNTKNFWGAEKIKDVSIRSDILIKDIEKNTFFVLDTKWKIPTNLKISIEDLRQMYVYYDYYNSNKVALIYPITFETHTGYYFDPNEKKYSSKECSLLGISFKTKIDELKEVILEKIQSFIA